MQKIKYFVVICEEVNEFDGKIIHINEKVKNLNELEKLMDKNISIYPCAEWHILPCVISF